MVSVVETFESALLAILNDEDIGIYHLEQTHKHFCKNVKYGLFGSWIFIYTMSKN